MGRTSMLISALLLEETLQLGLKSLVRASDFLVQRAEG